MSPVGALQERCQSRGVAPEYRTIQVQVQVQVEDMVAMGSGSSEKEAEDAAARAMLDKLDGRAPQQQDGEIMVKSLGEFPTPIHSLSYIRDDI